MYLMNIFVIKRIKSISYLHYSHTCILYMCITHDNSVRFTCCLCTCTSSVCLYVRVFLLLVAYMYMW